MKKILLQVLCVMFAWQVFAEGSVTITESKNYESFDLRGNLFYIVDTNDVYTYTDILSDEFTTKLTQADKAEFLFPGNSSSIWLKLEVQNFTQDPQQLVLGINNPLIEDIVFFNTLDSNYIYTGANKVFQQRQLVHKSFQFNVFLGPQESTTCCIKISKQEAPLYVPITLQTQKFFIKKLNRFSNITGFYFAFELLFVLLAILLWRTEKNKTYLSLLLLFMSVFLYTMWRNGFLFQYIWSQAPNLNLLFGKIISILLIPIYLLFSNSYLKSTKNNRVLSILYRVILFGSLLFFVVVLFSKSYVLYSTLIKVLVMLLIIWLAIGIVKAPKSKLNFFTQFKWVSIIFAIDLLLRHFLHFDIKGFGANDYVITSMLLCLMFLIGAQVFFDKFRGSRTEVIDLNKNLESLVDKRTAQLSSQKEELKSQQEELILQKETLQTQREELRAQKELLEIKNVELEKLSLVASKTDNLIYIFDPNGELNWFNKSFGNVLGISLEEYQRHDPYNIVDVSNNKNIRHVLNTCLREKSVVSYESSYVDNNKSVKWFHTTLTPILDEKENIKHLIAIDTDITRLKQYEEELNQQKADAENQKNLAIERKEELEDRQTEITDSIRYAKRIQTAIMPKIKQIGRDFHDSFILFLPKDIVSGDFYWYHRIEDKYFIAAVDCTGHGVPGAFMSIIGNYLLNSIIIHNNVSDPAEILKQLNRKIKIALKTDNRSQTSDGMDISIAVIDKNNKTIELASALRPVYLFSKGDFVEIKGDKIPITSNISGTTISTFKKHSYPFDVGDRFYMFSDGIIDQFGGKNGKKFLTKRFKQLLFEINPLTMREQKEIIKKAFDDWKGENEQVDDVLIMGIKFTEERR